MVNFGKLRRFELHQFASHDDFCSVAKTCVASMFYDGFESSRPNRLYWLRQFWNWLNKIIATVLIVINFTCFYLKFAGKIVRVSAGKPAGNFKSTSNFIGNIFLKLKKKLFYSNL